MLRYFVIGKFRKAVAILAILGVTLNAGLCLCAQEEAPASIAGDQHRHAHPGPHPSSGHRHPGDHEHSGPAHSGGSGESCDCSDSSEFLQAALLDAYAVLSKLIAVGLSPVFPSAVLLAPQVAPVAPAYLSLGPPRPRDLALHLAIHLLSL